MKFEDLPIMLDDWEYKGEYRKQIKRQTTVAELFDTWDIDDGDECSEMAQVLRHLRSACSENTRLRELNNRALAIIADAIMHGMPVTREVADVRNQIVVKSPHGE